MLHRIDEGLKRLLQGFLAGGEPLVGLAAALPFGASFLNSQAHGAPQFQSGKTTDFDTLRKAFLNP